MENFNFFDESAPKSTQICCNDFLNIDTAPFGESASFVEIVEPTSEELVKESDLIIVGQHVNTSNQETFIKDSPLCAVSTFQVSEVLKGTYDSTTIDVFDHGEGTYYSSSYRMEEILMIGNIDYSPNEKVMLFLDYDPGNVLGDGYYAFGKYTITDSGNVEHYNNPSKDMSLVELKQIVNTHS